MYLEVVPGSHLGPRSLRPTEVLPCSSLVVHRYQPSIHRHFHQLKILSLGRGHLDMPKILIDAKADIDASAAGTDGRISVQAAPCCSL